MVSGFFNIHTCTYITLQSGKSLNSSKSVPILHEAEGKENRTRRFSELVSALLDMFLGDIKDYVFHHPVQAKNLNSNSHNYILYYQTNSP